MRVAIYARDSKSDGSQTPDNQLVPLRDFARSLKAEEVFEYVDFGSGARGDRENFLRLMSDAQKRKFELIVVWSFDRFSREGISNSLGYLERLKMCGVGLKSLKEGWLDTRDTGVGQLLLAIFAWLGQQERQRIVERTNAGLDRARREGKKLGRPKGAKDKKQRRRSGYWGRWEKQK